MCSWSYILFNKNIQPVYMRILFLSLIITISCSVLVHAQVRPNFPYSALGIGQLNYNEDGILSGMGNSTSAIRSSQYLNNSNPASLSGLQNQLVILELSALGTSATLSNYTETASASDLTLNRFGMAFKISPWWGTGFGIFPVSTVKYQIEESQQLTITGTPETYQSIYEGNGGLNEVYWANGWQIGKHFSAGLQLSYIFGAINDIEQVGYDINNPVLSADEQTYFRNFQASYGAQVFGKLSSKWGYTLGAVFQAKRQLKAQYDVSIVSGTDTLSNEIIQNNYFTLPVSYRGGIAITYDNRLTFATDYTFENWQNQTIRGNNVQLVNSTRYGIGAKYESNKYTETYNNNFLDRLMFEAGLNYNNSYLEISNQQLKDVNFSFGTGIYDKSHHFNLNLGFEVGEEFTPASNLISENYVNFYCTFILRDIWFAKRKFF
jgi:hypothetical protein